MELLNPLTYDKVKGVTTKTYEVVGLINGSFRSFGGTESVVNGIVSVIDTATIETWYRPDITAASRLRLGTKTYEVIGEPEDISLRHQYLKIRVRSVKGGA